MKIIKEKKNKSIHQEEETEDGLLEGFYIF